MSGFRFPLQRILELRARREQAAAAELASSQADADRARESHAELRATREANLAGGAGASTRQPTVGELRNSGYVLERIDERIRLAHTALDTAEARVAERVRALSSASRDRRALDRLRERQLAEWQVEQAQIDRLSMDAVALTQFTQRIAQTGGEG
jgi:flagellar protein FliJ